MSHVRIAIVSESSMREAAWQIPRSPITALLISGDRMSCCDEAVVATDGDKVIGICTLAPEGEMQEGTPTIVGLYIVPAYRKAKLGRELFMATLTRCRERGFARVRVDVMSRGMKRIIDTLAPTDRDFLEVHHCGDVIDLLDMFSRG